MSPAAAVLALASRLLDVSCLAANVYHEARGEPLAGRIAVAEVVTNRVRSALFPGDVCSVVFQRAQFSWTADVRPFRNPRAWAESVRVAARVLDGRAPRVVGRRVYFYHEASVLPGWTRNMVLVRSVGAHRFYRLMTRAERDVRDREAADEAGLHGCGAAEVGDDVGCQLAGR